MRFGTHAQELGSTAAQYDIARAAFAFASIVTLATGGDSSAAMLFSPG